MRCIPKIAICLFFLFWFSAASAQKEVVDSLENLLDKTSDDQGKIEIYYQLYRQYLYTDPVKSAFYVDQGYQLSIALKYKKGIVLGLDKLGGQAMVYSEYYKALDYFLQADSLLQDMDWPRQQAVIYGNFAAIYKDLGVYDSAITWNEKLITIARQIENRDFEAFGITLLGDIYHNKGQNEMAAINYMEALRIYETSGNQTRLADAHRLLAASQTAFLSFTDAQKNLEKAIGIYTAIDDKLYLSQSYRDLGYNFFLQGNLVQSEKYYQDALVLSLELEDPFGIAQAAQNLGEIAVDKGAYEIALERYFQAMEYFEDIGNPREVGVLHTDIAELFILQKDYQRALEENQKAEQLLDPMEMATSLKFVYKNYRDIYSANGQAAKALDAYQKYTVIRDSMFTVEKRVRMEELQLIYEVEKKDQEIILLSKDVALGKLRRQLLSTGLLSIFLVASLIIYIQIQRRRKEKKIQEEQRRRQVAELEKKELARSQLERQLAAQVLQLCRKNELLVNVQKEVVQLSKQNNGDQKSDFRRLERSISSNLQSDEDWSQFLSTFEQVHPDFLKQLREQAIKLSPAEQRLCCLFKMNLSSKDIATMLNISDEGVKKARYRLRKKLSLASDVNLQEYLINLPGRLTETL